MTPARPVTWSDEELRKALGAANRSGKMDKPQWDWTRALLAALGAVHPQEAAIAKREAEREAFVCGARRVMAPDWRGVDRGEVDRFYPSLLPPSPPPLVLSTGTYRRVRLPMQGDKKELRGWETVGCSAITFDPSPCIGTASDAEALAKWLRENGDDNERR